MGHPSTPTGQNLEVGHAGRFIAGILRFALNDHIWGEFAIPTQAELGWATGVNAGAHKGLLVVLVIVVIQFVWDLGKWLLGKRAV